MTNTGTIIHIVQAVHSKTPPSKMTAHTSYEGARRQAIRFANTILSEHDLGLLDAGSDMSTVDTALEKLNRTKDSALDECDVWITKLPVLD